MTETLQLFRSWEPAPVPWLALIATGTWYVIAASRVSRRTPEHRWPVARMGCFCSGLAVTAFAVVGPPGAYDDVFFYAHMTQHILLTMLAAPLLVLGDPVLLVLRASSQATRRRVWVPVLRSRAVHVLTNPVFGWVFFVAVMGVSHIPAVYDGFLTHPVLHDYVEHPLYLVSAMIYFQPLLVPSTGTRRVPHGIRMVSLFTMMVPMSMLGFFIFAVPHLAYPYYAHVDRPFGPGALTDQHLAGILMWSTSMVLGVAWLVVAGYHWLEDEERRTRRSERVPPRLTPEASA
ncbi:MAG: cytochrome c oxidase assembly protein [Nocardioides sp.]